MDADDDRLVKSFVGAPIIGQMPEVIDVSKHVVPNPPEHVQTKFVGNSFAPAYEEALTFVTKVNEFSAKHDAGELSGVARIIDFGSGWGRITRMLLAQIPATRIYAVDVDAEMTALVNQTLPGVNAITTTPLPPTALGTAAFDGIVAFSVFSHLSGPAHEAWADEFARLVRPGGTVAITVLDHVFLDQVAEAKAAVESGTADGFAASLAECFPDIDAARAGWARGELQYAGTGGGEVREGDFYGWAAAPERYVRRVWGRAGFRVDEWISSGQLFQQALVLMTREDSPPRSRRLAGANGLRLRVRSAYSTQVRPRLGRVRRAVKSGWGQR